MKRSKLYSNKRKHIAKPLVIILGEGKTEEDYIRRLKKIKYFKNVNIKFEQGDELNFEIKLKEHLENKKNVFVILDVDNESKNTKRYDKIKYLLNKYKGQVFYNNYSFETWLLNHKEVFSKPITNKNQYDNDILNLFGVSSWSNYKNTQNRSTIMNQIDAINIDAAKTNITNISGNNWDNNPSSNMDLFIDEVKIKK